MAAVKTQTLRHINGLPGLMAFAMQVLVAISVEVGDDLGRGVFSQRGTIEGIRNAHRIIDFETGHSFWVEPAWQTFFLQTRHILFLTVSWIDVAHVMNWIYIFGHVFVTLGVALWVYLRHRRWFVALRNAVILINSLALIVYENFPVAPPRLTTGIHWNGHPFQFQDTVFGVLSDSGRAIGTGAAYNEFSAMPSVHMAWAMLAGGTILILAQQPIAQGLGAVYPLLMLLAVVVTGNHYLADWLGAIPVTLIAVGIALFLATWSKMAELPGWMQRGVFGYYPPTPEAPSG